MPMAAVLNDRARRNVGLLAMCQAMFNTTQTMNLATTPLAAYMLLSADGGNVALATLPLFLQHFSIMATSLPGSFLMARFGRRAGFTLGTLCAIGGGLTACLAIFQRSFLMLCGSSVLLGIAASFAFFYRFAAAETADNAFRPKAISLVMAGGVAAGILGPTAAKYTVDWLAPVTFAGVYLAIALFATLALIVIQGLQIAAPTPAERMQPGRPLREIARQPAFPIAVVSGMFGFATMTLLMSATPLAMQACGFKFGDSANVIQAHVIGMFLPSFFTGHLITRFGVLPIIMTGAVLQALCAIVNLAGVDFWNFYVALALVGIGWNFTYVGGTTLLTSTYRAAERAKVQGINDFLIYAATATAAGTAGLLQGSLGWTVVNQVSFPLMVVVLAGACWLALHRRTGAAAGVPAE